MENNAGEIEVHLNAYLNGRADQPTRQLIEAWLRDKKNLPAYYELLFRFESDYPIVATDAEQAFMLCMARLT